MKTYSISIRVGVVEDAMLRETLKKQPSQQGDTRFLEKMIAQEYKKSILVQASEVLLLLSSCLR